MGKFLGPALAENWLIYLSSRCELLGFGDIHGPKTNEFIPKANEFIGFGDVKERVGKVDDVIAIVGEDTQPRPHRPQLVLFLLLGTVVWSPKVQTFVYCEVVNCPCTDFIVQGLPEFPCELRLGVAVSRLCEGCM